MIFQIAVFLCFLNFINGANILGIYFSGGKSHHILGEQLLKELARRGHNVTMASAFPLSKQFPNYTDIHLTGILEDQKARESMFLRMNKAHGFSRPDDMYNMVLAQTELTLNHTEMAKLVKSGTRFDAIIIDWFMNPSFLIYGKLFDAPVIPLASVGMMANHLSGNPVPQSYVPFITFGFPSEMTFFQRVVNGVFRVVYDSSMYYNDNSHQELLKKYFENPPSIDELVRDYMALILSNSHYSFEAPRPLVPSIIPIGGFHVEKPKPLPEDIQKFMDSAENGVIYFSLGSNMKSTLLPQEKQLQILKAFSKIPYKVMWKWEDDNLPGKPDNVLISKWFPQNDVLGHPNLKLFVSHGGLLSSIEALYHGVPVVGIPFFLDQKSNIPNAVQAGYALQLEFADLNDETLEGALNEILNNPKYAENAKRRSHLLHDQPLAPMDKAVFWIEHVIRHKGGHHLRNAGIFLSWYQYLMLDVAAFVLMVVSIIIFTVVKLAHLFRVKRKIS